MSVQSQIDRINENVASTYSVLEEAGAEMPQTRNSNNLPETAASISAVLYGKEQALDEEQKAQARKNVGAASIEKAVFYIEGNSTTDGVWTGNHDEITSYFDGLTVAYKTNIAGASGGTTLNINGLGAVAVNRNASTAVTTIYPVGSVIILTYSGGAWLTADYDANTKTSAGSSNKVDAKMFLIGATSQSSSGPTTYSNKNVYIGTDNCLYSNGEKTLTASEIFTTVQETSPDYINQVPISTDVDGNILNGVGYQANAGIGSDGSIASGNIFVSGFIPVKTGDVIRIKHTSRTDFGTTITVCLYQSDKTAVAGCGKTPVGIMNSPATYGEMTIEGNVATWKLSNFTYAYWKNCAYLRVQMYSASDIVTVNEPITESTKTHYTAKPVLQIPRESQQLPMTGKKVVCFGDSLIGQTRDDTSATHFIARETGATVYNVGFGGAMMSATSNAGLKPFTMCALADAVSSGNWSLQETNVSTAGVTYFPEQLNRLKSIDFATVDVVVIHYGTNDFTVGVNIDSDSNPNSTSTTCGALRYSIEKLLTAYPKLRIYVSLPCFRHWGTSYSDAYTNDKGKTLVDVVNALREVAAEYNLPVIDSYYGLGINKANATAYLSDGTHHTADGRRRFGEYIAANLISQQTIGKGGSGGVADAYSKTETDALIAAAISGAIGGAY